MKKLQQTTDKPFPIVPRLIAGGILTFFSLKHFGSPQHFANIMTAAGFPMAVSYTHLTLPTKRIV